jgi:O-antigen/teichoic acid export membrane protein
LTWRAILLGAALGFARSGLTLTEFFFAAAGGIALSIAFECVSVRRRFPEGAASALSEMEPRAWLSRSRAMWLSAVVEAASQYAEVVLLGLVTSPAVAGEYFVAARIANVFLMLGTGLHTYSITHAANLFFAGELKRLQSVVRSVMTVAAAVMTPLLCALLLFAPRILLIFGQRYAEAAGTVLILSTACFIVSMTGPSPGILLITGFEKLYSRVIMAALVVRFALIVVLAHKFGAPGAAFGWALANAPVSIVLAFICRAKCGIDPSVLSIFPRSSGRHKAATG